MDKKAGFNLGYLLFALLAIVLLRDVWTQVRSVETVPYSTFEKYLSDGKVDEVSCEGLGYVAYAESKLRFLDLPGTAPYAGNDVSPETAQRIDAAIRAIVHTSFDNATTLLRDNRAALDRCAEALLDKETLDESEIRGLTADLQRRT